MEVKTIIAAGIFLVGWYVYEKTRKPFKVLGVAYNREKRSLELLIQNIKNRPLFLKSSLRLVQAVDASEYTPDGDGISYVLRETPMMSGAHKSPEKCFSLLAEDRRPLAVEAGETLKLSYDVRDTVLGVGDKIRVDFRYGKGDRMLYSTFNQTVAIEPIEIIDGGERQTPDASHTQIPRILQPVEDTLDDIYEPLDEILLEAFASLRQKTEEAFLSPVPDEDSFVLKTDHWNEIARAKSIEELRDAVANSPLEAVKFHLRGRDGNDFAWWARSVAGDETLARRLENVYSLEVARARILDAFDERIQFLRKRQPVLDGGFFYSMDREPFVLKRDHDDVVASAASVEELRETVASCPLDAVAFHLRDGNDFAWWAENIAGDYILADSLSGVKKSPEKLREQLLEAFDSRIREIRGQPPAGYAGS